MKNFSKEILELVNKFSDWNCYENSDYFGDGSGPKKYTEKMLVKDIVKIIKNNKDN